MGGKKCCCDDGNQCVWEWNGSAWQLLIGHPDSDYCCIYPHVAGSTVGELWPACGTAWSMQGPTYLDGVCVEPVSTTTNAIQPYNAAYPNHYYTASDCRVGYSRHVDGLLSDSVRAYLFGAINAFRASPHDYFLGLFTSLPPLPDYPTTGESNSDYAISGFGDPTSQEVNDDADAMPAAGTLSSLTLSNTLCCAAQEHCSAMQAHDIQDDVLPGEADLGTRVTDAGHVGWSGLAQINMAYAQSQEHARNMMMIDWNVPARTHRNYLLGGYDYIGIGVLYDSLTSTGVGPLVISIVLASGGTDTDPGRFNAPCS